MANDQFFSFDEALDELRLKEEELKRLVSEGEIRAFREGETMKLRRADVEALRSELSGGEVVDLGDVGEDLVFEDDTRGAPAGMATEEITEADTLLEEDIEDLGEIDGEIDLDADDEDAATVTRVRRTTTVVAPVAEEESEAMWVRALVLVTTAILVLSIPVCLAATSGELTGLARGIAGIFATIPE